MIFKPTPPQPSTVTELPGATLATLMTEPNPVITPHPTMQAEVNGIPSGKRVTAGARTRVSGENGPILNERAQGRPFHVVPSGCACALERSITYAGLLSSHRTA